MSVIHLAGGPVSWGVDFADTPGNPAPDTVLDGIAAAGLCWTELGPVGYLPPDPGAARAAGRCRSSNTNVPTAPSPRARSAARAAPGSRGR